MDYSILYIVSYIANLVNIISAYWHKENFPETIDF